MCFSASVSFGASALLAGTGIVALRKNESRSMLPFACTPILFSVHQLAEGFLWLSLKNPDLADWYNPSLYSYLFVSQVLWPVWVPFIVWLMEPDRIKKKWLSYFALLGGATMVYMIYSLAVSNVSAVAESGHIHFSLNFPWMELRRILYFLTTLVPLFISSLRYMKLLAVAMFGSLILTFIFYTYWVISVWCFFAALLSALVLLVISQNKETLRAAGM